MKVYEWRETKTHYIAIIRPKELFDESTMEIAEPEDHQAYLSAKHLLSQEMEGYAIAYGKGWRQDFAKASVNSIREVYLERDSRDLEQLHYLQSQQRKTA